MHRRRTELSTNTPRHWWWNGDPMADTNSVCIDIDGVLADVAHRVGLLDYGAWDEFFHRCGGDELIASTAVMVALLDVDVCVVLLTSRPAWVAEETLDWLRRHHVRWDLLIMRPHHEYGPASRFKVDEVERLREHGLPPIWAIDDDIRNVEAYERAGVATTHLRHTAGRDLEQHWRGRR